jgi:signal transduction histidine kinase
MGELVRAFAWEETALGPMAEWPQSLRTVVRMLLTSRFAMWMGWGPELTFLYNDAYARMTLGKKHPWALGRPAREVWAEIWPDIQPRIRTVMQTGAATWDQALLLFLERSGYVEETYHTFSYSPLHDDRGSVEGMLCVVTEETERVIGERRLDSLRALASALAATIAAPEVLAAVESTVGANARDLPFTTVYLFDEEGGRARLACRTGIIDGHPAAPEWIDLAADTPWPAARMLARGEPMLVPDLHERFDGLPSGAWGLSPRDALVVPIARQGQERPAGFLVAGIDPYRRLDAAYADFVTLVAGQIASSLANARAYEEERRRAEALAELDRAKTQFFGNVSHEFRTPLTLLLGPVEDGLADPETSPANRERLEVVHRNARRLLKLVNTLLDFSRIEAERADASYTPADFARATADLASTFRSTIERAGLRLAVECEPVGDPVYLDHEMWEKVVLNLLSNAFKHTFEGTITVATRRDGDAAELEVRDTGVGIPAEQLPHIFERFHRVPNTRSRTHEGTGIGLALVHELVRLHGGTVSVASEQGSGTTFTVRIPVGAAHLPAERLGATRERASTAVGAEAYVGEAERWLPAGAGDEDRTEGEAPPSIGRVLLADDNADVRDYVARLLDARGWEVLAVGDGRAALAAMRAAAAEGTLPDIVLSDVMMPGLDGFALLAALRADPTMREVPVILLSARAGEEARLEGAQAGADDYIVKPFSARDLTTRVETVARAARERRAVREATEAARIEAENANRAKSEFLAVMSHELRTPLNAIAGYVQLLDIGVHGSLTDEQREVLARVERSQRHLLRLINDVLNLARIESGRIEYEIGDVPLAEVVSAVLPMMEPQLAARGLACEMRVAPGLVARTDREKTQQILLNLLQNACKFTPSGGRITVEGADGAGAGHGVMLRVIDTGIGIPRDKLESVFEPFVQVDSSRTRRVDGTGLGLAISRDLARGLGGDLTVESVEGRGSTFTLRLPGAAWDRTRNEERGSAG